FGWFSLYPVGFQARVIKVLCDADKNIDKRLLSHLSPLGWERISLTDDYIWHQNKQVEQCKF
ncbi:hypothetical protein FCJ69_25810, partial [Escherichia coli]|nr:hypothetical protein [Escherichia coli]EFC1915879.1 hypothetical protein [Escherichia coli]EFC1977462.1 hypothetical protein [Escherichia coli]EFC1987637.1 hypothetical protein [Escherichia coli]EFC6771266.1 hypothetical protein [Escherichia coli]